MAIVDALVPELDHEIAVTRKLLERVPVDKSDWKPHARSSSLGQLASHIAWLPGWGSVTLQQAKFDVADFPVPAPPTSREALLTVFDQSAGALRSALVGRTDAELMAGWTLTQAEKAMFTMPRATVLRSFVLNHLIHHRGQLSVYLRQLDIPIPSIYGPSADEAPL